MSKRPAEAPLPDSPISKRTRSQFSPAYNRPPVHEIPLDGPNDLPHPQVIAGFEVDNYIIKHLGTGNFGIVYASIPKCTANEILQSHFQGELTKSETCTKLREELQAAKILRVDNDAIGGFRQEIRCLEYLTAGGEHMNIVKLLAFDKNSTANEKESNDWFTQELLSGSTFAELTSFQKTHPEAPLPAALGWHLIHQLTVALLALHFDIKDGSAVQIANPKFFVHTDLGVGNMMFRYPGTYKSYPDLVLADFGEAYFRDSGEEEVDEEFFELQREDYQIAVGVVVLELVGEGDARLLEALDLEDFGRGRVATDREGYRGFLTSLGIYAKEQRDLLYEELGEGTKGFLGREVVSDGEFAGDFPQLGEEEDLSN